MRLRVPTVDDLRQELSTILGAGLMGAAIVLWIHGRITIGELEAAATCAAIWIGIPQRAPVPSSVPMPTTLSIPTAPVVEPAQVMGTTEHTT